MESGTAQMKAAVPQDKEFIDERSEEMVELVKRGLVGSGNDAKKTEILRAESQCWGEVEAYKIHGTQRTQLASLLVASWVEPIYEQSED